MDMSFDLYVLQSNSYELLLAVDIYKDDKDIKRYVEFDTTKIFLKKLKVRHLRDYVRKEVDVPDININKLKLWKLNGFKLKDIKEQSISTEEDIVQKLHGEEMQLDEPFSTYFQAELDKLDDEDYEPLVKTFGKDFKFCGRDDAINIFWNGDVLTDRNGIVSRFGVRNESDKNLHPIPVVAGGPGTGKSRFLDEVEQLLSQCANESGNYEIREAFANMTVINTTYGNGSPADDIDINITAQASLAIRILFEYFRPQPSEMGKFDFSSFRSLCNGLRSNLNISNFTLSIALQVVSIDIMRMKQIAPNSLLVLVLGIDEFNKLHDIDKDTSKKLVHSIGGIMCSPPNNVFFIPILAGTIEGPLDKYVTESMHKPLRLPLYLLEEKYAIEIGKAMNLFDDNYVKCHPYFRVSIGDIGGHARSLEYFYRTFEKKLQQRNGLINVKLSDVMLTVEHIIRDDYNLVTYSRWLTEVIAKAILGLPVKKMDEIMIDERSTSYQDLNSMGILNLVLVKPSTGDHQIRLPYTWASVLVRASKDPGMTYWKSMFDYDEPMYWQNFEDFNAKFWALRLSLFHLLGYKKIKLGELLNGAKFSRGFPEEAEIILPEDVKLCKLRHRYPATKTNENKNMNEMEESSRCYTKLDFLRNEDVKNEKYMDFVFLNAPGAPWDVFGFHRYVNYESSENGIFCIAQQIKYTNIEALEAMIIDQNSFNDEYEKVSESIKDVPIDDWALLFLTNAESNENLIIKCKNDSALVSRKQFHDFYGFTYASRAQFASANEKIFINSAPSETLKILGFTDNQRHDISLKRPFSDLDDMKTKLDISENTFKKLKRGNRIIF
ncbi:7739_t:CDS:2 [Funneliformis caledonium]|uniref:7739_t:CDS:1 n=1 Tax=Funneliformis caledonium TaxID=1117310 RepID=A0A9N9BS46_9GLOM|nr:7739_t:CDS:2 [Funneliformis caledonium]